VIELALLGLLLALFGGLAVRLLGRRDVDID
jgi:hypothetical protein